jgi:uncharacterized protein (DUF1697 family)
MRLVALLRGINVGGRNLIRMPDLSVCIEEAGLRDVAKRMTPLARPVP